MFLNPIVEDLQDIALSQFPAKQFFFGSKNVDPLGILRTSSRNTGVSDPALIMSKINNHNYTLT